MATMWLTDARRGMQRKLQLRWRPSESAALGMGFQASVAQLFACHAPEQPGEVRWSCWTEFLFQRLPILLQALVHSGLRAQSREPQPLWCFQKISTSRLRMIYLQRVKKLKVNILQYMSSVMVSHIVEMLPRPGSRPHYNRFHLAEVPQRFCLQCNLKTITMFGQCNPLLPPISSG